MADQLITKQELIDAQKDVKNAGEAVNTKKVITPRYGDPFKSIPLVVEEGEQKTDAAVAVLNAKANEVVAKGFYTGYATETALKASLPDVSEMRARADDTRKIWRWNRTSAEGVTPVTGTWIDTGPSDVDVAVEQFIEEAQRQGVALNQLDDYYNYLMQRLAQIAVDKGWDASFVTDGDKNQKQINDLAKIGKANIWVDSKSYSAGDTVKLNDGTEVVSAVTNNTVNPNLDPTGWEVRVSAKKRYMYASDYKIKGDGTDESAKVKAAFNALQSGFVLDFEGKTVVCEQEIRPILKKGFVVQNGSILKANGSQTLTENRTLQLDRCEKFAIHNFDIDGNRDNRTPRETATHTVSLRSCKDFVVTNSNWVNGACDNLNFDSITPLDKSTHTQNGLLINCKLDKSYRNNASLTAAQNLEFVRCRFTNANGALPMAGVDLETNIYGGYALIDNIYFTDCEFSGNIGWQLMVTHHDSPRNIVVRGGKISAPDVSNLWMLNKKLVPAGTLGATQLPTVSDCGGSQVTNPDTMFFGVNFQDFPKGAGTCLRVGAELGAFASILSCKFKNLYNTGNSANPSFEPYILYTHGLSDGIYVDLRADFYKCNATSSFIGTNNTIQNSIIKQSGLFRSVSGSFTFKGNTVSETTSSRAVLADSVNAIITDNTFKGMVNGDPIAYIQAEKAGAIVDRNTIIEPVGRAGVGIRFDRAVGRSMRDNNITGLGDNPYFLLNPLTLNVAAISGNTGGTQRISTPNAARGYSTQNRPTPNSVPLYSSIFDTTLKKLITSDGVNWYDHTGLIV